MIIGIAGPKRSGKTTLAQFMADRLDYKIDTFAAPIRQFVAAILGVTLDELERIKEDDIRWLGIDGMTPRHMMQTVGTEWGRRMIHSDLWTEALMRRIDAGAVFQSDVVIPDVRFPNEARGIIERGGMVIGLRRPGAGEGDMHVSEQPLTPELVTVTLNNDGDPLGLYIAALEAILKHNDTST